MSYESKFKSEDLDQFFKAIISLKNEEECYRFFEDICTYPELESISKRLRVAIMLNENATYHEIEEKTGVSTATISRINKCLKYGADGYKMMLERLE